MNGMRGSDDEKLDALFQAFGGCPAPEPSVNFMPSLWARIEASQSYTFSFRRMANAFVTAALALSIGLAVYMSVSRSNSAYFTQTYVDALAEASSMEGPDLVGPALFR